MDSVKATLYILWDSSDNMWFRLSNLKLPESSTKYSTNDSNTSFVACGLSLLICEACRKMSSISSADEVSVSSNRPALGGNLLYPQ